jgi:uncharacterized protein
VSVHPPAQDNQANQEVVKLLAEHFSVPKSAVTVLRGRTSRRKLIGIG